MNIKQLNYFYQLAQTKHFAKAAKACHVTQPTLSASIANLEKAMGIELVVRGSQFVALTQAGQIVLAYAEKILQEQAALKQALTAFNGTLSGQLRIGIVPQSNVDIMPIIQRFNQHYPQMKIKLNVTTNNELITQLEQHQIDIGLGFNDGLTQAHYRHFNVYPQGSPQMAVLFAENLNTNLQDVTPDQLSNANAEMSLADLHLLPLVLLSQNMQFRQYIDNALAKSEFDFNVLLETDSLFHLVSAVKQGIGCAIVSTGIAHSVYQMFDINYQLIKGIDSGETVFITRAQMTPAIHAFIDLL